MARDPLPTQSDSGLPKFTDEEFKRILKWAHEGLLVSPAGDWLDDALYARLDRWLSEADD